MLTPRPWPRWSAETLSSILALRDRLAFVRRRTWNVAHSNPMVSSFGRICRFQRLSRLSGVFRSVGKPYRGVNVLMLWATAQKRAYTSNEWATYRQWQEAGAQVRKGEC